MKYFTFIVFLLWASIGLSAEPSEAEDEVDSVALAARLMKDGHYDRARAVLVDVSPEESGVDRAMYHTLLGLLALEAKSYQEAVDQLDDAVRYGKIDDIVFVYLAQGFWGLKDFEMTVRSVDNADEAGEDLPRLQLMKAQALLELDRPAQAWEVLSINAKKFPEDIEFDRRALFLLIELGLTQEAASRGRTFLASGHATQDDYVATAAAFSEASDKSSAIAILEEGKLSYPAHLGIQTHLAHAYGQSGNLLVAAGLFQEASRRDARFVLEAAELYRRAGAFERALYMNAGVGDQAAKIRQRVSILVDMQRFEAVVTLEARAKRLGLFSDQPVLYALAYARFSLGDYAQAEALLKKITDPELFRSATQIRQIMTVCKQDPSAC